MVVREGGMRFDGDSPTVGRNMPGTSASYRSVVRRWPFRGLAAAVLGVSLLIGTPAIAGAKVTPAVDPSSDARELRFESQGYTIAGTLHLPASAESVPAVVVAHGAGTPTREEPLYRHLTDGLPALGFAVFVYDRRDSGESEGDLDEADYHDLAADAVAAKRAVAAEPEVDGERMGFWGLSQGGWIAVLAASRSEATFVVSASAPLTTPAEQMHTFVRSGVLLDGHAEEVADRAVEIRRSYDAYIRGEIPYQEMRRMLAEAEEEEWFPRLYLPRPDDLIQDIDESRWRLEMDYDPTGPMAALEVPALVVFGENDWNIPVERSLEILDRLPARAERKVLVIPDAGHALEVAEHPRMDVQFDPERSVPGVPSYFLVMGAWLAEVAEVSLLSEGSR